MEEKNQLPLAVMASACLYFVLVLCKNYKETGSQMSTREFATANQGQLIGLTACALAIAYLTAPNGGKVMSFGGQPDELMDFGGFYDPQPPSTPFPSAPNVIV